MNDNSEAHNLGQILQLLHLTPVSPTINNIKGETRIDLSYSIQNFDSDKEIAVIRMLTDNVKHEILKLWAVMDPISDTKR